MINAFIHSIWFPQKSYRIPDQNGQSVYPFLDHNGAKPLPDGAAFTYMAYIREYPPPPRGVYSNVHFRTVNYPCTGDLCCNDIDNLGLVSTKSEVHLYNQKYWQYRASSLLTGIYFRERLAILLISVVENFKLILRLYF